MEKTVIHLFVDDSAESKEAKSILDTAGVRYVSLPSSSVGLPAALVGHQLHTGLSEIWKLANGLKNGSNDRSRT